jgi:hypothetical protein
VFYCNQTPQLSAAAMFNYRADGGSQEVLRHGLGSFYRTPKKTGELENKKKI